MRHSLKPEKYSRPKCFRHMHGIPSQHSTANSLSAGIFAPVKFSLSPHKRKNENSRFASRHTAGGIVKYPDACQPNVYHFEMTFCSARVSLCAMCAIENNVTRLRIAYMTNQWQIHCVFQIPDDMLPIDTWVKHEDDLFLVKMSNEYEPKRTTTKKSICCWELQPTPA